MRSWLIRLVAIISLSALGLGLVAGCAATPGAEKPEQFYQGKTISFIVSSRAGTTTDLKTRVYSKYLEEEIGATVKVEALGTEEGSNIAYTEGSKDGLTLMSKAKAALLFNELPAPGLLSP